MTTIQLTKSGNQPYDTITIFTVKVQEQLDKDLVSWANIQFPMPVNPPTASNPGKDAYDLNNINRSFTIVGRIDSESTTGSTAQHARDTLINMMRSGGNCNFFYGITTDATSSEYSYSDGNIYYNGTGFVGYITRIMIDESPKGGTTRFAAGSGPDKKMPESYEITITFVKATEVGQ